MSSGWVAPVLVTLIGAFMATLDSSIINVAIPAIMNVFNASPSTVQWISTSYLLTLGVVVPLSGWLGDKLGYKRLYMLSLAVFVAGSLFCALSWDLNSLIAARVMQAIGGGMIVPTMTAMIFRIVPQEKIGGGMGVFGIAILVAPAIGPTLGGYLVEFVNWRWIFTINLPIGVIGIILSWIVLPEFQPQEAGRLDVGGAATSITALFCLLLALSKGPDWGWGAEPTILLFFSSFVAFVLFVYIELTTDDPLLELRVFRYTTFTMANLTIVATQIGLYAGLFFLPLFLQNVRGLGALETGLLLMPGALVSGLMMPIAGNLFDKIGPRPLIVFGLLLLTFITYTFHNLNLLTAASTVMTWVMIRGVVLAFASMPAQTAALAVIPKELVGRASALYNIINRISGSFGIAVLTSLLTSRQAMHGAHLSWAINGTNPGVAGLLAKAALMFSGGMRGRSFALAYMQGLVGKAAFVDAIDDVFIVAAVITLVALVPALFLKKGARDKAHKASAAD
jgi:EmrB/QacA subfamily drug resistance transporter